MLLSIIYKFTTQQVKAVAPLVNTNYIVKSGKYFIPDRPKRYTTAYFLFANQMRAKLTGKATQNSKIIAEQWKKLSAEQRVQYQNQANVFKAQHDKELAAYRQLYQKPFKNLSLSVHTYIMQSVYGGQNRPKSIPEGAVIIKQKISKLTPQQKAKIQEEIKLKRELGLKGIQKYKIPVLEYDTQRKYLMAHCKDKSITELTQVQREKLQANYKKILENHQVELRNFALKFNLTLVEFQSILKKFNRKQNKQKIKDKAEKEQQLAKTVGKFMQTIQTQGKLKKSQIKQIQKKLKSETEVKPAAKKPSKPRAQATRTKVSTTSKKGVVKAEKSVKKSKKASKQEVKPESKSQTATTQPVSGTQTPKVEVSAQKVAA